jgi:anti-sigma B factor antagonist
MKEVAMGDTAQGMERDKLTIFSEQHAENYLIRLDGELDLSNARKLEDEFTRIEGTSASRIVLDLARLEFIDSTGLCVIMSAHSRAAKNGRQLGVTRPHENVMRIFELCGLERELTLVEARRLPSSRGSAVVASLVNA